MSLRNALAYINKRIPLLRCTIKYFCCSEPNIFFVQSLLCWVQLMLNGKLYVKYSCYKYSYRGPNIKILLRAQKTLIFICSWLPKETYFKSFSLLSPQLSGIAFAIPESYSEFTDCMHLQTRVHPFCSFCINNSIEPRHLDGYRPVF